MKAKITALALAALLALLPACGADTGAAEGTPEETRATAGEAGQSEDAEESPAPEEGDDYDPGEEADESGEAGEGAQGETAGQSPTGTAAKTSEMAALDAGANTTAMVLAFEVDYARAAEQAGTEPKHGKLDFVENEGTATINLGAMMLMIDPPGGYNRVWYAGYAESEEWMREEAGLVLMAAEPTLTADEARELVDDIFEKGWENRDNLPSAVSGRTPGGLAYSYSTSENGLVSFQIMFGH